MSKILTVTRKELWTYFSSPTAYIFLGTYLLISMFTFFWVEKFFSRNIADLRPLFEWMPLLLIFLIATLTMKMWSEERRMGTIEFLLTLPVKTYDLVLGKFLACLSMVGIALMLTLGLALSVGVLGKVDWGPVFGAYFATLLLASTYIAIGLYVSSKTQNPIVSLIVTALIGTIFYVIGSDKLSGFFGNRSGEILKLLGTGSRFDSISRGVIDFRDIYYYLSIAAAFLVANTFSLDTLKWAKDSHKPDHRIAKTFIGLLLVNLIAGNFWLQKVTSLRADLTANKLYSISQSSIDLVNQLDEPLLIIGYFSERTHPLLAPLVPAIRDFLREYQLASHGKIRTKFIDPRQNEEMEAEASRKYHIEPAPFQTEDRSSVSIVNSYFNIVVQYGDQFEVLGFDDLIEYKHDGMGRMDVRLRNPEYDIGRAIRKTLQAFKNTDSFFAKLDHPIKFVAYVSEAKLPKQLKTLTGDIKKSLTEYQKSAGNKLTVEFLDPSEDQALAKKIGERYGFMPQSMSLLSQDTFYFYLTLEDGDKIYSLGVPQDMTVSGFKHNMDAALKRMMPGFLRNLGLYTPPSPGYNPMMGQMGGGGKQFRALQKKLQESYSVKSVDLDAGQIPSDIDILMVLAPHQLNEKQVFAIDQFLMKGGTVILSTSPVSVSRDSRSFVAEAQESGLEKWLGNYGIDIPKELVLDKNNIGFPTMRKRVVQGVTIREPHIAPYPFFIDVREKGLSPDTGITANLGQVTMAWPSPILVDNTKNSERKVTPLVQSSKNSWRTPDINIDPNPAFPELGFAEGQEQKPATLAVLVEGRFDSYFKGKLSPLVAAKAEPKPAPNPKKPEEAAKPADDKVVSVIEKSSNVARIIVFASNEFIADDTIQIVGMLSGTQYSNPLQLVENALDWSVQDRALLAIRSRGYFARTLLPLSDNFKQYVEILNYVLAMLGLLAVWGVFKYTQRRSKKLYKSLNIA